MSLTGGTDTPSEIGNDKHDSILRRSWTVMAEMLTPFSPTALASLPRAQRPARYLRADAIPHTENDQDGQRPTVRDYHSINAVPSQVRVPKKIATPIRVEGKVWFANERSMLFTVASLFGRLKYFTAWIAWLNNSILLGTMALALFNTSKDPIARYFAYFYAFVSIGVLVGPTLL